MSAGTSGPRDLFRGRAAAFLPGEAGDGPALCRLLPAGGEPRHILGVAAPPGLPQGVLERTLERLTQLYDYYDRVPAWEPGGYKASYLESGVARELLLGDGDLSRSVFGNLYDLRLDGEGGGSLRGGYVFAALEGGRDASALHEPSRAFRACCRTASTSSATGVCSRSAARCRRGRRPYCRTSSAA